MHLIFILHYHCYLDKYSSGFGFRIRVLALLAWSNFGITMTNNLIIVDQMVVMMISTANANVDL